MPQFHRGKKKEKERVFLRASKREKKRRKKGEKGAAPSGYRRESPGARVSGTREGPSASPGSGGEKKKSMVEKGHSDMARRSFYVIGGKEGGRRTSRAPRALLLTRGETRREEKGVGGGEKIVSPSNTGLERQSLMQKKKVLPL